MVAAVEAEAETEDTTGKSGDGKSLLGTSCARRELCLNWSRADLFGRIDLLLTFHASACGQSAPYIAVGGRCFGFRKVSGSVIAVSEMSGLTRSGFPKSQSRVFALRPLRLAVLRKIKS